MRVPVGRRVEREVKGGQREANVVYKKVEKAEKEEGENSTFN